MNDAIMSAAMQGVETQQTTIESELSTLIDEDRGINNSASIMNYFLLLGYWKEVAKSICF
jgi:hypothetical protein